MLVNFPKRTLGPGLFPVHLIGDDDWYQVLQKKICISITLGCRWFSKSSIDQLDLPQHEYPSYYMDEHLSMSSNEKDEELKVNHVWAIRRIYQVKPRIHQGKLQKTYEDGEDSNKQKETKKNWFTQNLLTLDAALPSMRIHKGWTACSVISTISIDPWMRSQWRKPKGNTSMTQQKWQGLRKSAPGVTANIASRIEQ